MVSEGGQAVFMNCDKPASVTGGVWSEKLRWCCQIFAIEVASCLHWAGLLLHESNLCSMVSKLWGQCSHLGEGQSLGLNLFRVALVGSLLASGLEQKLEDG